MSRKLNIRVPDALFLKIEDIAIETDRNPTTVINESLERALFPAEPAVAPGPAETELPAIRTIANLQRVGILKPASQIATPRAVFRPFCAHCGGETVPYRPDPSLVHCKLCGRNWSID